MPDFSKFDLSGREPRPIQVLALRQLNDVWSSNAIAITAPCGTGKSALARSIQCSTGCDIIVPSNILLDQNVADYPGVNFLKGKAHYTCRMMPQLSCQEFMACGFDACDTCPYQKARADAADGYATIYNPMSFYYYLLSMRQSGNAVMVIDEAHLFSSMMLLLCGKRLKKKDYKFDQRCTNEVYLCQFLSQQIERLTRLGALYRSRKDTENYAKVRSELDSLGLVLEGLRDDGQNYSIWISKEGKEQYLNIKPLFPPRFLLEKIVGNKKLILLSATLFDHTIREIVGQKPFTKIELNSPIPRDNRKIYYKPADFKVNYQTDRQTLVTYIEKFLLPNVNTIVHSTYSMSKELAPLFKQKVIFNKDDDKDEKLAEFKRDGGVFLASGCSEGIDLKYDTCRRNIIPKLLWPNLMDPAVIKRKSLADGDTWYALTTLTNTIQAAGRSTRAVDDYSETFILDPNFGRLFYKYKHLLPRYFTESIVFPNS